MRKLICLFACLSVSLSTWIACAHAQEVPSTSFALPKTHDHFPGVGPVRHADWFEKIWYTRRASWQDPQKDQGAIVFLGDSITQGFGDDFQQLFPGLKTANRGISGDTTRGMLYRLPEDVLALNPKCVVLLLGTNDIADKATPEEITQNLKLIVAALNKHDPKMPIVLNLVFPSSPTKDRAPEVIKELNRQYQDAVKDYPQVTVVDTWTLFANAEGNANPDLFPDLLHLNAEAYQRWAATLHPVFTKLGIKEGTPAVK